MSNLKNLNTETFDTEISLEEYNIYINFLNDYYSQQNPKPIKFDSDLSKKLFA